jgi:hypothetical protein
MILVSGYGRGGTRVPMRILREAGLNGDKSGGLGGTNDTYCIMQFAHDHWDKSTLQIKDTLEMVSAWQDVMNELNTAEQDVAKDTRLVFFLPTIHRLTPDLKFLHIVRDGRDIAVQEEIHVSNSDHVRKVQVETIRKWNVGQLVAAKYAEVNMNKDNYLLVRLEDIIENKDVMARKILDFGGVGGVDIDTIVYWITKRKSVGAGRKSEHADALTEEAYESLERFGYL